MVKVNFKTASPIKRTVSAEETPEAPTTQEPSQSASLETFDLSFDTTESLVPRSEAPEQETSQDSFVQELQEETAKTIQEESAETTEYEDETSFSFGDQNKKTLIAVTTIGIIAILVLFLLIFVFRKGEEKVEQPIAEVPAKTEAEATSEKSASEQEILSIYQKNLATNLFIGQLLQKVLGGKTNGAQLDVVVITPGDMNLSAVADSRDKLVQFHLTLKHKLLKLPIQMFPIQEKYENGKKYYYAGMSANLTPSRIPPENQEVQITAQPQNIETELRQLAQAYHLEVARLKQGQIRTGNLYETISYYLHLNGTRKNVVQFLDEVVKRYPMIRFDEVSLYFSPNQKKLSSKISFTFYNIK